ncbi:CD226 antigen-like [Mastacembelus armatus]|uniref:CD226 antigen-like n=1 Tax=Mastacembelus armatus TaxID=205130 RepID=UPI000E45F073|nr:CD226 antigen-like [Mastacembelus armatus]
MMSVGTSASLLWAALCLWVLVSASGGQRTITAEPGQNVTLTCRAPSSSENRTVEWTRPGLDPDYVFVYRNKKFDPTNQHPSFKERVELKDSQMKDGDVSVTLKNVTFTDTGIYECRVAQGQTKAPELINITHLRVSADITAEPGQNVTLTCRAPSSSEIRAVEWTRPGLDPDHVFVYRNNQPDPTNQHPSFKERVELKDSQMKDGDVSVTLKNVTFTDTGTYECRVLQSQSKAPELTNITHLTVNSAGHTGGHSGAEGDQGGHVGLAVGLLVLAVLTAAVVSLTYRKLRGQKKQSSAPADKAGLCDV